MGHQIYHITCKENVNRSVVMANIAAHAKREGDGYSSKMTWHDRVAPLESEEEAENFIKSHDNGWYDDHAVRFKDYSKAVKTKKIEEYEAKIKELAQAKADYQKAHSIRNFQAKLVGCPKCNSKLNKEYLRGDSCPLCRADLRSKTTLDKLKWFEDKISDYRNRIEAEKKKQKNKVTIKWLIKYEFHS